jgi:hypothetical protein
MNDAARTVLAVVIAAALGAAAWMLRPAGVTDAMFSDVGEVIAPGFTDPLAARSLEVVSYDEATASFRAFKVEFDGSRWVIPSHHNYPADAAEKVADAASALVGLRKERVVSDSASDHEALGVLAPDDDTAPLTGRGTRVTVRDGAGGALVSVILGGSPEGAGWGQRYVREEGKSRVYLTTIAAPISTAFADWIQTDLLQLAGAQIDRVSIDRYQIDETQGVTQGVERLTVERDPYPAPGAPAWTLRDGEGGPLAEGERVDDAKVQGVLEALRGLRIVGVRPKPENLANALAGAATDARIGAADVLSLQARGFYLNQNGQLLANEGQATASTNEGVVYTLWFGEIAPGEGDALTIGVSPEEEASAAGASSAGGESRYLVVTVSFDESAVPAPPEPAPVDQAPDDEERARRQAAWTAHEALLAQRTERINAGREKAKALAARFSGWYYVIDGSTYDELRPSREDLVRTPGEAPAGPEAPEGPPAG